MGANFVWRYTTDKTQIQYGEREIGVGDIAPPLVSGRNYYWLVANNYDKSSNVASTIVSDISQFYVDLPSLDNPKLTLPLHEDSVVSVGASEEAIRFEWEPVEGAVNYRIFLTENLIDGNEFIAGVWDKTTSQNYAILEDPIEKLRNLTYYWKVFAFSAGGASQSEEFAFDFQTEAGKLELIISDSTTGQLLNAVSVFFGVTQLFPFHDRTGNHG